MEGFPPHPEHSLMHQDLLSMQMTGIIPGRGDERRHEKEAEKYLVEEYSEDRAGEEKEFPVGVFLTLDPSPLSLERHLAWRGGR